MGVTLLGRSAQPLAFAPVDRDLGFGMRINRPCSGSAGFSERSAAETATAEPSAETPA
jgi:hypothetical protein